ncbi:MAG: hypothetical protein QXK90_01280 [Candidatus Parvarchaeota archaeon]
MVTMMLKRYGLEKIAKVLIAAGLLLVLVSWLIGVYYFTVLGKTVLFIGPLIFTLVSIILLVIIRYRYTILEKYPYLMNLPSLFYRIKDKKGADRKGIAFSMIFTVHALVMAFMGVLSIVITISIANDIHSKAFSPFLYSYFVIIAVLIASVLLQYRRIYLRFSN